MVTLFFLNFFLGQAGTIALQLRPTEITRDPRTRTSFSLLTEVQRGFFNSTMKK